MGVEVILVIIVTVVVVVSCSSSSDRSTIKMHSNNMVQNEVGLEIHAINNVKMYRSNYKGNFRLNQFAYIASFTPKPTIRTTNLLCSQAVSIEIQILQVMTRIYNRQEPRVQYYVNQISDNLISNEDEQHQYVFDMPGPLPSPKPEDSYCNRAKLI